MRISTAGSCPGGKRQRDAGPVSALSYNRTLHSFAARRYTSGCCKTGALSWVRRLCAPCFAAACRVTLVEIFKEVWYNRVGGVKGRKQVFLAALCKIMLSDTKGGAPDEEGVNEKPCLIYRIHPFCGVSFLSEKYMKHKEEKQWNRRYL